MIAGHNGAGKSTCYRVYLQHSIGKLTETHIDPDKFEREIRQGWTGVAKSNDEFSLMAMKEATQERQRLLEGGASFSFETVFSDQHGDKLHFMQDAQRRGYYVVLLFVGLDSPDKSRARVTARHQRGGHDVPTDRIYSRYPRVLANALQAVSVASLALLVDNSIDSTDPEKPCYDAFAMYANGQCVDQGIAIPQWAGGFGIVQASSVILDTE